MVGATIGASVVCLVAVFDEPRKAVIAIIYYVVYQQLENYVVAPRIMQRTVSVPGAVTVVAALAGGTLLGVLGALLAIPVAAGLLLLYEEVLLPRQRRH
jgi:predicted PurR-regulated permease PerM